MIDVISREDQLIIKRCAQDPIFFIRNFVKVQHPIRGLVPFRLYPFQREIVKDLMNNRFNILRKFRQAGCTTIVAGYALWMMMFQDLKTIAVLSKGDIEAVEVLDRVKLMYDELPDIMKSLQPVKKTNEHTFQLRNRSVIKSRSSAKQSGRGLSGSLIIFDEAAFIDNIETIWSAALPATSTGGSVFVLSTVNGVGNWYHQKWVDAVAGANSFHPSRISYKDHPEYVYNAQYEAEYLKETGRDFYKELADAGIDIPNWEKNMRGGLGPRGWKQEYEAEFLGTGDTYIDGEVLEQLCEETQSDFYELYNGRMRVWKEANPSHEYMISADSALGRERDSTVFLVFNIYTGELVAEFKSNTTPLNEATRILAEIGKLYNTAMVIPERNSIGINLIEHLMDLEYESIWYDDKGQPGFLVNATSRETILALMEEFVRTRKIKIVSQRVVDELLTFIVNDNNKAEADEGCHDDMVMALAIACFGLKNLISTTPVDSLLGDSELSGLDYADGWHRTTQLPDGSISREDLKWLISE